MVHLSLERRDLALPRRLTHLFALALLLFSAALARPSRGETRLATSDVPDPLKPWVPWVLADIGDEFCIHQEERALCSWPGQLSLRLTEQGGEFRLVARADRPTRIRIPGGPGSFPYDVRLGSKATAVTKVDEAPHVELPVGTSVVEGRFAWTRLPETLEIGATTAALELWIEGGAVPEFKREQGKVWLRASPTGDSTDRQDSLELSVFRKVTDGPYLHVETRLIFQVSGKAREMAFERPLVEGTSALQVSGDLAVALEPNGRLRVQLAPGRHQLTLSARAAPTLAELRNPVREKPWPEAEIWTFHAAPALRAVEVQGVAGIDGGRTDLPTDFAGDSAYLVPAGSAMKLATTRRGEEQVRENQLDLRREFWLDQAAREFTVVDHFRGEMNQRFRLESETPRLGAVRIGGREQLVTLGKTGKPGVEIREAAVDLEATSRLARTATLGAVGWSESVRSLQAELHLPPGWDVFTVLGVDESPDTWVARWDLFNVFYALVVAVAMLRLAGPLGFVAAAGALVLCRDHTGAPDYLWLPWLGLGALVRFVPEGGLRRVFRGLFGALGVVIVVVLLSFAVSQVRRALYPHLQYSSTSFGAVGSAMEVQAEAPAALDQEGGSGVRSSRKAILKDMPVEADTSLEQVQSLRQLKYKPDSVVQTGPGVPSAEGPVWHLGWSGPVVASQKMTLYLLSPAVNAFLTVLRLLAVVALFFFIAGLGSEHPFRWLRRANRPSALALALVLSAFVSPEQARAQDSPSNERLLELKARLSRKADCEPNCVSVARLHVELGDRIRWRAEVSAAAPSAYQLPGPFDLFSEWQVTDNGVQGALRLEPSGALLLRLEPGVHQVEFVGRLLGDRATVDVGTPPERVTTSGSGYVVTGVGESGTLTGRTLTFQKESQDGTADLKQSASVPPYFLVERTLELGVTSSVSTRVERLSQAATPEVLELELLPFERIITPSLAPEGGVVELSFSREETSRTFQSNLLLLGSEELAQLRLKAGARDRTIEVWNIRCGVVYSCEYRGLVPTSHVEGGQTLFRFHPWPGEELELDVQMTRAAPGVDITVRSATLTLVPGVRNGRAELDVEFQTSRSRLHTLSIPATATIERALVDGVEQSAKLDAGKLRLALEPGVHSVSVHWIDSAPLQTLFSASRVDVGAQGVNFRTIIDLPPSRWILLAGGPPQGPALLFWGYLILIAALAAVLPRLPLCPLPFSSWLLLGLGLTQVPVGVAVFIGGWFFAVASRRTWPVSGRRGRNFLQLLLVGYSLAFIFALLGAVYAGLVSSPDMSITGAGSYGSHLVWYLDRSEGLFASTWVVSVNVWFFRGFMLLWSLWLASASIRWLKWGWSELQQGGFWVKRSKRNPHLGPEEGPDPGLEPLGAEPTSGASSPSASSDAEDGQRPSGERPE